MRGFRRYPEYRDSGVEWLGEIPAHWEVRRLKEHVEMNASVLSDDTDSDYMFDYVDIGSVEQGRLSSTLTTMRFGSSPSRARRVVRPGDTLVSTVRTYLKAVWTPTLFERDMIASTGFAVLTPKFGSVADYLGYFCQSDPFTDAVSAGSVGIAYPAITEAMLGFVPTCVPPLPEQRTIADFLERQTSMINRLVRKKERLIELLDERRRSLISHAATRGLDPEAPMRDSGVEWLGEIPAHWEVRRLKDHVEINALVLSDDTDSDYMFDYVDIGSVEQGRLSSTLKTMRFGSSPSRARRVVSPGDTLVLTVRTYLKAVWTPTLFERDMIASTGFAVLTPRFGSVADYLGYFCQSDQFTDAVSAGSVGIAYPAITEAMLGFVPTCVPPLPEQSAIADFLDRETGQIDALVAKTREAVERLREYRASVISAAVTGQIDVRAPQPSP